MKLLEKPKQSTKANLGLALLAVLLVVGVLLMNVIVHLLSSRHSLYLDLTENAAYEIGEDTITLLESLSEPVEIFVLSTESAFDGSNYLTQAKRIIQQYPRYSDRISLTFVDYASDPTFVVGFPDLNLSSGDIIVRSGQRVKQVPVANLFHYTYTSDGSLSIESSRAEEALTSAILNVADGEVTKIAILTGNGVTESKLFTALLADNNYDLTSINLTTDSLEGYDAALLLAPVVDLSEEVLRKLDDFLYNDGQYGKTLFYTASATQGAMPNLDAFLAEWGIAFSDGAVFETKAERTYQYQPFYPIADYSDVRYKSMLRDASTPFLMPLSRPMTLLFSSKDGYYTETLLQFAETAGVRPADAADDFSADNAEIMGPLPALALSTFNASAADGTPLRSSIIISASTGIFDAVALQNTSLTNSEYLPYLLGDLTDQDVAISIQSKSLSGKTLGVTSAQVTKLGMILCGVLPLTIMGAGIVAWLVRRYK